jgi:tetratricopeptide (TPR) repeat protein
MKKRSRALDLFQKAYEQQMKGDLDEAISLYKRSIEILPTAEAYTFLGWTYSFQGRYDEAIQECEKAILQDPEFGNPYNDIGAYLIEQGRHREAIPYLRRALSAKRYESQHYPHFNLGRALEKTGQWTEAIAEYREAMRLQNDYVEARRALRNLLAQLN